MHRVIFYGLLLLLLINVLYAISGTLHIPMQSVDVVGIWLFKAKAFYIEGGLPLQTLKNPDFLLFHPQYPLLLPFLYSSVYRLIGGVHEQVVLLFSPVYYIAVLGLAYAVFRRMGLTVHQSLTYTYLYSMFSPLLAQAGRMHAGTADIVITLFAWGVVWLLHTVRSSHVVRTSILITLIAAVASQVKMEGLFLATALCTLPLRTAKKALLIGAAALPFIVWRYSVAALGIPSDFVFMVPPPLEVLQRVLLILSLTIQEMVNVKNWYIFWPLFWMSLTVQIHSTIETKRLVIVALLISGLFSLVYLTVTTDVHAHLTSSLDRVLLQISPFFYPIFVLHSQKLIQTFLHWHRKANILGAQETRNTPVHPGKT